MTAGFLLDLFIPGAPVPWKRTQMRSGQGFFKDARTRGYQDSLAFTAHIEMQGKPLLNGPVGVAITAIFPIPVSWSKKKQVEAVNGRIWHISRPDFDNLQKQVGDALNGIVWKDDSQIARCSFAKVYGEKPGLHVFVEALA